MLKKVQLLYVSMLCVALQSFAFEGASNGIIVPQNFHFNSTDRLSDSSNNLAKWIVFGCAGAVVTRWLYAEHRYNVLKRQKADLESRNLNARKRNDELANEKANLQRQNTALAAQNRAFAVQDTRLSAENSNLRAQVLGLTEKKDCQGKSSVHDKKLSQDAAFREQKKDPKVRRRKDIFVHEDAFCERQNAAKQEPKRAQHVLYFLERNKQKIERFKSGIDFKNGKNGKVLPTDYLLRRVLLREHHKSLNKIN